MEEYEYNFIKRKVLRLTGVDLSNYKSTQVKRRLGAYLARSNHLTWPTFFRAIQHDQVELGKLKDYLTINVSSFFRDPEKFEYLRESILPELLRGRPRLRVWSAGCSHGHEPYSLAIMLARVTGLYCRHFILATDIDRSALERAQAGGPYKAEEVVNVPPPMLRRYFRARDDGYRVIEGLRRKVTFRHHDLLAEPFESEFDLIICRNVVIYFKAEVKQRLYQRFHDALRPEGVLFLGGTEIMSKAPDIGFETLGMSIYRRITG